MPRKILIVDDSKLNRMLLKKSLSSVYDIIEAENGKEALSLLNSHDEAFSAVLMDIVMPEMDGYEALSEIRNDVRFSQLPVIMVTGSEDEESRVKALSLGANDFITKPFNPEIVKHCLKNNIALRETASILNAIERDKLTGLYNREAFFEKVSGRIAERESGYYVMLCFDIDDFKLINDQYGSIEGDRILREIGSALKKSDEENGSISGHISADNYAMIFPEEIKYASALQSMLAKSFDFVGQQAISFSIGCYVVNDLSLPASAIYDRAFIAKQSVKGRYDEHLAFFDDTMLDKLMRDRQITGEMEEALEGGQFEAWYQPQYDHSSGALIGAEALARWRHPKKGIIPPGNFIPLFEQNGFIYEMDKYIWRDTCRRLREWLDKGYEPIPVSVNISRYDIFRADLTQVLEGLLEEYNIPVDLLRLEVTESAFTDSAKGIVDIVKQLIGLGFTVEIDDFGSGYSSLNTLKNVPAQVVKLDMRFLEGGDDAKRGGSILESIVRMAKWLGMTVIAEGVEELEQADFLKSIGCTQMQGYLFARPMPADEFGALLCKAEKRLFVPEVSDFLLDNAFWDSKSVDSAVFSKYSGGACVYEFHDNQVEMIRATDKYVHTVFGPDMSCADAMKVDMGKHADKETLERMRAAMLESLKTKEEVTDEYLFIDLPGCPHKTYLRSSVRVIASTEDSHLLYCTVVNMTAQREAEERNAAVADRLKAVMDNVSCGITAVTYDEEGKLEYLMINDRYYELLGYTEEQYEKIETFSPIYHEDRQEVLDASKQVYDSGEPRSIEYRFVKRDGSIAWMRVSMTMTKLAGIDRKVQLALFYDIMAERQASVELLDNLPCGAALYELDDKGIRSVHINKRYWELVDHAPMSYAGLPVMEYIHPEDRGLVEREIASAIKHGKDISCDIRIHYGNKGQFRPFRVTGHLVPKDDGKYYINVLFAPISDETVSIQDMLPIALQSVMDYSAELTFVKDRSLNYITCSRSFALLAEQSGGKDLIGKTVGEVFPPEVYEKCAVDDRLIIESGQSLVDFDMPIPTPDGTRHLLMSKYPLLDSAGNVLGILGTGRDVTQAREEKTRLELLTNNIPGGIAVYEGVLDASKQINLTYFSDGLCSLFGYSREEYEGLSIVASLGLDCSEDVSGILEKANALVKDGVPMDYVYRANVNGGDYKWINIKAVIGENDGEKASVNAVFFDVTERQSALEKLRMSEEVKRVALGQSKNVVCQYDIATRQLLLPSDVNPIYEVNEIETDVPYKFVSDGKVSQETSEAYIGFFESILRGEKSGEALYQKKSTIGWRWIDARYTTIFSDDGKPVTAVISYIDVTEDVEKDVAYRRWQHSLSDRNPKSYSLYHCNISKNTVIDSTEGLLFPPGLDVDSSNIDDRTSKYVERYVFDEDRERFLSVMDRDIQLLRYKRNRKTDSIEYREKLPNGEVRWLKLSVDLVDSPYSSDIEGYLIFEDIDEAKRAELEMIERAETDPLTGVLNRSTFIRRVDELIGASEADTHHALIMLDIDGFKLINDVFGHGAGDQALIDVAEHLRKSMRRGDLVGRLGGDEFVIFLSDISNEATAKKAQQICNLVRKNFSVEVQISGSLGIALYPQDGDCFEALYKKADDTLYHVKGTGKNAYAFYHDVSEEGEITLTQAREEGVTARLSGKKRRMLIVDDSKTDYAMLANMFEEEFIIEKAMDGASAMIKLNHYGSAISIVLLDLVMPGMSGFEVLNKIQHSTETKSIPVIVVSSADDGETGLRAIRAGAADFVTKPVNADILRVRVRSAVSKAENERLRAQNSFLELQSSEIGSYEALLERTGTVVIVYDWLKSEFIYSPSVSKHLYGRYDSRSLWRILLSDMVADSQTVKKMQQLVHDVANDRSRTEAKTEVKLKSISGGKHAYEMNIYKQADNYGLTNKLILTLNEISAGS